MNLDDFGMIWSGNVMINEIFKGGLAGMRGTFHLLEKKTDTYPTPRRTQTHGEAIPTIAA